MPRPKSHTREEIVDRAMHQFWRHGFAASSIDDLVRVTGVSRHGIYTEIGGKEALFVTCLAAYVDRVVTPAFARVEQPEGRLDAIAAFFEHQIARAEARGLLDNGCLMVNTMTDTVARTGQPAANTVREHFERLRVGFLNALRNTTADSGSPRLSARLHDHASALVVFSSGLWSMARLTGDSRPLRRSVRTMIGIVEQDLHRGTH